MGLRKHKLIVAVITAALLLGSSVGAAFAQDPKDDLFQRVRTVYNVVEAWHKDGADADKFTAGAIKGGLEALGDPYTNYFSPGDYKAFLDNLNGSFSGIGAILDINGNYVVISSPIKGSPAEQAGLQTGDRLLEANETPLLGATTEKAVSIIRGPAGTTVTLKVERPSEKRTFTLTITRQQISIPEVDTKMLDNEVGYLQLSSFGDDSVKGFYKGVDELKAKGAKALVLDLRQNGGGYVDAAVGIASAFVPKDQPILWEVGKTDKTALRSSGTLINLPAVVLVDRGTASASEILSGALQDYGVAPLVGVTTFGKGTVQQILSLSDGAGIKVTVAEYLTAKERHVHHIGLTPDYVVENPKPDPERTSPMSLNRAILPGTVGLDVLYLQYRLQDLGYQPETTGAFGLNTQDAAADFAKDNGLDSDPVVSDKFVAALNQKVADHTKGAQKTDAQLQKALELARMKLHQN